jgi:formate-dependent phosphoribosylglycinamide formyltransferase (GAR transformylase)
MKKALLLGSSFSALPLLSNLQARGYLVTVVGKYEHDPCHQYADRSLFLDYSDEGFAKLDLDYASYEAVVPSCNDYSYLSGAKIAELFGQAGYDSVSKTQLLHEKHRFRRFCNQNGIRAPRVLLEATCAASLLDKALEFPAIVKPVDSFSGRGTNIVHDHAEALRAVDLAIAQSRVSRAIVEQFVDGSLHSHSAFIRNGAIVWEEFVDEFCGVYPYQVDRSQYPSCLTRSLKKEINSEIVKVVEILGLVDGLMHTQFIARGQEFWIIECMRRCPGDLFPEHFSRDVGSTYWQRYLDAFLGLPIDLTQSGGNSRRVERHVLSTSSVLAFYGVALTGNFEQVTIIPVKESGRIMNPAPYDKAAIVFIMESTSPTSTIDTSVAVIPHDFSSRTEP